MFFAYFNPFLGNYINKFIGKSCLKPKYFIRDEFFMQVEKHLYVTATSDVSWKDAITKAISEASKTIDYLSNVKVLEKKEQQ